ncbi:glycosyl hydrolase 53 family protein [Saccharophagus degradans]|uniref:glycosyl hydrolase 53 family protein n=1 Tax=Saccharophagus degradans TaxID=86304 RepID=UPI002477E73D|nr:glycosyl hydrolase 53 family protein [Saccharophagus degradans]WGO98852.1 glycosyl hydrolase 53 family protein [Saccharophagus degradans]
MTLSIKKALCAMVASTFILLQASNALAMAKGADVSWISEMEAEGYTFYNDAGQPQDVLQILKDHGMDSIRLRVWVDPAGGWYSSINDVIEKAQRAKAAGMRIMIDFHYSDSWADPGKQYKPAAWVNYTLDGLMSAVWWHTYDSLTALKNAGITPEWVQVGNETNNGMLWEEGRASANMQNYAWLVNSGYDAVKEVFPNAKAVVHLANCHDNANFRWIFDGLQANGGKWDVIGASIYPTNATGYSWSQANSLCEANLNDMQSRYGSEVLIAEVGAPWDHPEAKAIVSDVIAKAQNAGATGVFYWEPQASNWQGYTLGAWNPTTMRPTEALDAFIDGGSSVTTARLQSRNSSRCIDVNGRSTADGADIIQWSCHSNANQQWTFEDMGNNYVRLRVGHSNKCLDVLGAGTADGDNVVQWACHNNANQQWLKEDMGDGYFRLKSRASGKCVDVNAGGANNGDSIIQWSCHTGWNQQWMIY